MRTNDVNRALKDKQDQELNRYLEAKNSLKNTRIKNMLEGGTKNKEIELLIESGLIDHNPENLQAIMARIESEYDNQLRSAQLTANGQSSVPALSVEALVENSIQTMPLKVDMIQNKDFGKLKEFFVSYLKSKAEDIKDINQNIGTIRDLQAYENKVFQQRYDALNFRYKGQVTFDWLEQPEMLSYIKHDTKLQPKQLLQIFHQNFDKLTRSQSNVVMTPAVCSQIYAKMSLFKFPETLKNNKINMLADPSFIKLEQHICNHLEKLSDSFFADVVHSFSENHAEEQGSTRPKAYDRMLGRIWHQAVDRINYLDQGNLGLVCKALTKIPQPYSDYSLEKGDAVDNQALSTALAKRIDDVNDVYTLEQVCLLASIIPDQSVAASLYKSIPEFAKRSHDWDEDTLVNFGRFYPVVLLSRDPTLIKPAKEQLRTMISDNSEKIKDLISKISINNLRVFGNFLAAINVTSPPIINRLKKCAVDSVKQQKTKLTPRTVPDLMSAMSYIDYLVRFQTSQNQWIDTQSHIHVQQYFLINCHKFNSVKLFPFHQFLKFISTQVGSLSPEAISTSIRSASLAGYKNQGLYDQLVLSMTTDNKLSQCSIKGLVRLVQAFAFQKRVGQGVRDVVRHLVEVWQSQRPDTKHLLVQLKLNFLSSVVNLGLHTDEEFKVVFRKILDQQIAPYSKYLSVERKLSVIAIYASMTQKDQLSNNQTALKSFLQTFSNESLTKMLSTESKLLYALSTSILKLVNPNLDLPQKLDLASLQTQYEKSVSEEIKNRELAIGCNLTRQTVQKSLELYHRVKKRTPWRIVLESEKKVQLVYTYDMLVHNELTNQQQPYGIWKLYELYYSHQGYQVSIIKSYQWQKTLQQVYSA